MAKNTASKIITYRGEDMTLREVSLETTLPLNQLMFKYEMGLRGQELILRVAGNRAFLNGKYRSAAWMSSITKGNQQQSGEFGLTAPTVGLQKKGAARLSEQHCPALLTPTEALEVFHLAQTRAYTQDVIADMYGISNKTVSNIKRGRRWGWLTAPLLLMIREETKK